MKVFEYGSGGSTLFFARRVYSVNSIEHDRNWYENVKEVLDKYKIFNVTYQLIAPEFDTLYTIKSCLLPDDYISCFSEYKGLEFSAYARSIEMYPDETFDIVVVDGRVRHSCIMHAMKKVKAGGLLLLDNADRTYYTQPFPELYDEAKWTRTSFCGHFPFGPASVLNQTDLFQKVS